VTRRSPRERRGTSRSEVGFILQPYHKAIQNPPDKPLPPDLPPGGLPYRPPQPGLPGNPPAGPVEEPPLPPDVPPIGEPPTPTPMPGPVTF
jgi:hypothetical protein